MRARRLATPPRTRPGIPRSASSSLSGRLSGPQAVAFAQALPPLLGAMFLFEWDPQAEPKPFAPGADLANEARQFRIEHSFLPESAIEDVAAALWRHVDRKAFARMLATLPPEARAFWAVAE